MKIKKFNFDTLKERPFNMSIVASTGQGKTTLLKYILNNLKFHFKFIYLITNDDQGYRNNKYYKYVYPNHVFYLTKYEKPEYIVSKICEIKKFTNKTLNDKSYGEKFNTLIIFDDVGNNFRNKLKNFTNECRHAFISTIFLVHKEIHLDPDTRDSMKFFVINKKTIDLKYIIPNTSIRKEISKDIVPLLLQYEKKFGLYIVIDNVHAELFYIYISEDEMKNLDNNYFLLSTESSMKQIILEKIKK
ncbi:ORF MSV171 ATP/GTP binding motif homolog (vaccinia A32L), similar to GB:D11079 [Melanoplus sanguinipes entomopoxvirus]|uniref:DNA packaging protein OPG160 n=1 Tax=Melanoplus sanguinipes entomopoxvirus TaxID=83191 RepID=Q9YVS1_MSEPV|nr:ORF MSV171 ATP/GTP binding motif homolog (vaccinia A32L), similar to GB:D11079 [Melanoplus sanguinipes entomopoxvirus]AAC97775.1 ORF MSV171 ATP/GTP binding motif homolog (vaccinia A32L), similar to GB:D11079 [Melanoplus sanguinipes entomopoxvirus 'O']